jgi:hypothetical protein
LLSNVDNRNNVRSEASRYFRKQRHTKIRVHRAIILPVVLYACETCSLTLQEEHGLRVNENRVLRRIFGPQRDEIIGEWRRLHNEELNYVCSSPNIVRLIKS